MTPLAEILAERIRRSGPLTFADWMSECLYHPIDGYYSKSETRRFADYYTNVDMHPVFGRLLARQFAEMWEELEHPAEFVLVEAGAGTGRLAGHILDFCETKLPDFYQALRYIAVERSSARREHARDGLNKHETHSKAVVEIPARIRAGCVFSNELIDALPVHRVLQCGDSTQEIFVGFTNGEFHEIIGPVSTCAITEYLAEQSVSLLDSQQAEVGLEACDWISEVGRKLERGYVLTIDYGHHAAELFDQRHMRGTLLAYRNHRATEEFLKLPGEQDLTAHVNFTALETWGKRAALTTAGFATQAEFLVALGSTNEFADLYDQDQSEADRMRARLQLKTLIHPEGMGERFMVLVQSKGVTGGPLTGLAGISGPSR